MTVRVGVVGAGWIGKEHIRHLTDTVTGARVTAVTDIDAARAEAAATPVGARVLPDGAAVIAADDVDAVLVTSWGPTHAEHVLTAIAAGKPVFCEKPLATTAEDFLRIIEAETAHGRRLVQVGFMRRYDAGYRQLKQIIHSGRTGEPLLVHCVHRNPTVPESYTSDMAALDTAVHEVDVLRWLLDDEIVSTQVITPRATSKRFAHLKDPQIMLFETAKGVRIDLEVFVNCQYGYDIQCEAVGEKGLVRLPDPAAVGVRSAGQHSTEVLTDWVGRFADAFNTEFREWIGDRRRQRTHRPLGLVRLRGHRHHQRHRRSPGIGPRHRHRPQAPTRLLRRRRVKIALDPYMFRALPIDEMVGTVAELGYEYIELSPRDDFMPFSLQPRADDQRIAELKNSLRTHGVKLSSVLPLYKWSSPDETERQTAVRYWKRMIEITADLECPLMNSEFNGRPEHAAASEAAFWRSLEDLLSVFEREDIALNLEAHPDDFCEENTPAVDLVRAINKPWVTYLYCAPHSFHLSGASEIGADIAAMMRYAGDKLQHVHIADSFNHKGSSGLRYILNPPGTTAPSTSTSTSTRARSTGTPSSAPSAS